MTYVSHQSESTPNSGTPTQSHAEKPHRSLPRWMRWMGVGIVFGAAVAGATVFGGWQYLISWLSSKGI